jgi:hypothetical protein
MSCSDTLQPYRVASHFTEVTERWVLIYVEDK